MNEVLPLTLLAHVQGSTLQDLHMGLAFLAQGLRAGTELTGNAPHWAVTQADVRKDQTYAQSQALARDAAFPDGGMHLVLVAATPQHLADALQTIGQTLLGHPGLNLSHTPVGDTYCLTCEHKPRAVFALTLSASVTADTREGVCNGLDDLALALQTDRALTHRNDERSILAEIHEHRRLDDAERDLNTERPDGSSKVVLVMGADNRQGLVAALRRSASALSRIVGDTDTARQWIGAAFCQRLIYQN